MFTFSHLSVFSELSLIIVLAMAVALCMRVIRQPLIIGHILTGILIGPSVLHLIKAPETIEVFSNIGIALLLFIIGLGLNLKVVREVGKVAAIIGGVQIFLTAAIGYASSLAFGFNKTEAIFLAVAYSFSSTIIILKLLNDKKEQLRLYGKIATGLLLIQDIAAAFALMFVTATGSGGLSTQQLTGLLVKGGLVSAALLLFGGYVLPRFHRFIASSQEFLFLFALGWGFGAAALFEQIGFSIEVGALIAGVALAALPYTHEIAARLRPLRDFFIVVFFISLGSRLAFQDIATILPIIVFGSFVVIVLKPLIVMVSLGMMGYTKRTSFKASVTMGQISEFSLVFVIIGNAAGLISNNLVAAVTMIALISIAVSTYIISYSDKLYLLLENHLHMFERAKPHAENDRRIKHDLVLLGYLKGGHEFLKLFKSLGGRYVVVDYDPEVADQLERIDAHYVYGDVMDIELLEELGIEHAKLVVCTVTDHETNVFITKMMEAANPNAVVICHADNANQAAELYEYGASYVMVPHYVGSERMSQFIRRSGLSKAEFKKYREKHLAYLQHHLSLAEEV